MTRKGECGFTLVDFLIVLCVLLIFVSIAASYMREHEKAKLLHLFGVNFTDIPGERPLPESYITLLRPLAEKRIADICSPEALKKPPTTDPGEIQVRLMREPAQKRDSLCLEIRKTAIELGITPPYLTQQQ